jgi:hypothetical protein
MVRGTKRRIASRVALGAVTIGLAALASAIVSPDAAAQMPRIAYGFEGKSIEGDSSFASTVSTATG